MKYENISEHCRHIAEQLQIASASRDWAKADPDLWYVLRVEPQKEFTCKTILNRIGLEVRVPHDEKWIRQNKYKKREKKLVERPLLKSHIFAHLPKEINWHYLLNVKPITGVLCNPNPIQLTTEHIDRFDRMGHRVTRREKPMPTNLTYKVGDVVEVLEGPLEGYKVQVKDLSGWTAKVLFDVMGSKQKVEISAGALGKR